MPIAPKHPFPARLWKFASSIKLGIFFILTIAVVLAWATFYEAANSTEAVQTAFYRSWWFEGLLLTFACNLICATFTRWPFKARHVGFIVVHIGILTILAGSVMSRRMGVDGELLLTEGETKSWFTQQDACLSILRPQFADPGVVLAVPLEDRATAQSLEKRYDTGPMRVELLAYDPAQPLPSEVASTGDENDMNIPDRVKTARQVAPALRIRVTAPGEKPQEHWVYWGASQPVFAGQTMYTFELGQRHIPIGFSMTLNAFTAEMYPGTQMPSSFRSEVVVEDPARGEEDVVTIAMNQPLTRNGYTFFQSSYIKGQNGAPDTTVLSVARDPGMPVVYVGCAIMVLGLLTIFYVKPYLVRWEINRIAAKAAAKRLSEPPRHEETKTHEGFLLSGKKETMS